MKPSSLELLRLLANCEDEGVASIARSILDTEVPRKRDSQSAAAQKMRDWRGNKVTLLPPVTTSNKGLVTQPVTGGAMGGKGGLLASGSEENNGISSSSRSKPSKIATEPEPLSEVIATGNISVTDAVVTQLVTPPVTAPLARELHGSMTREERELEVERQKRAAKAAGLV